MEQTKIALVTGSSRGLGKNTALRLAQDGTDLIITYNSRRADADQTVAKIAALGRKAIALQLDTANTASFEQFAVDLQLQLDTHWSRGNFDFLVNNAGIDRASSFADTTEAAFDELFNVHFKGVYFLTQRLSGLIADGGRIVNFSTGLTRFSTPGYAAYASMKGGIEVFTRYLAKELGTRRINANTVAPGIIFTDFTKAAFDHHPGLEDYMSSITALGRVGVPEDIGGVVAFLCSENGRWVNAQRIEASGGMFL